MYDRQLAAHVEACHPATALAGEFIVMLYARPGQALDELVKIADAEIERLQAEGPTERRCSRPRTPRRASSSWPPVGRQEADFLNSYNVEFGDPLAYKDEMRRLFAVTPADVQRVARQYLTANGSGSTSSPARRRRGPEVEVDRARRRRSRARSRRGRGHVRPLGDAQVGPTPEFTPPPVVRRTLSNGLEVLVAERHELPILTLNLVVKGGESSSPPARRGSPR